MPRVFSVVSGVMQPFGFQLAVVLIWFCCHLNASDSRSNFIFVLADDVSWDDLGCYGHPSIQTPNLDQMAAEGARFNHAYLTTSSCSPSRCSIITGRYPHNTGAAELHTTLPAGLFTFPAALKEAGYYTVLSGKHHMGTEVNHGFDLISNGKGPGKEEDWVPILRDRPRDKPFFFWFASTDAHRDWSINEDAPVYEAGDVVVPPYLVDGPRTRKDLADYYHEVSRIDTYVGKLREELKRQGIAEDTFLIFMADNGRPFPRCKTRLYDSGIKSPLLIVRPGKVKTEVVNALVSSIDISATILEWAGLPVEPRVQGISFAGLLDGRETKIRDLVFAERNWHVNQAHERMVRKGDWVLIRNAWPELQTQCVESSPRFPAGEELWAMEGLNLLRPEQRDIFLIPRPRLELYNVKHDPDQLYNLAGDLKYSNVLSELSQFLDQWTEETGDTVPLNPTNDRQDALGRRNPDHARGTMPGEEKNAIQIFHPGPT